VPIDLEKLLHPGDVAVVVNEVQRDVVGDQTLLPGLKDAATEIDLFGHIAPLLESARRALVPVVHCTVGPEAVPDAPPNYPGGSAMAKRRGSARADATGSEVVTEIGPVPSDIVVARHQGVTPFTGTELDGVLHRLGVRTIVACGVSLNVGIIGLCAEGVSLGYRVVVATDAVVGVPVEYGYAVLANTLPFLATRLTVKEISSVWDTE
jgi:nicotinamidase-related amidase